MSHRYAVLGLLVERRGYGYELAQRLEQRVGAALSVRQGAVYRALRELERDELARSSPHRRDIASASERANPRIVFEATEKGVSEFERWLRAPVRSDPFRHELALKVALARPADVPLLEGVIEEYERACLERLEARHAGPHVESLAPESPWSSAAIVRDLELRLVTAELGWVRELRHMIAARKAVGGAGEDQRGARAAGPGRGAI